MTTYIYYPRGVRTGGPEALHQLAAALTALGSHAVLVPTPKSAHRKDVPEYEHFDCEYVSHIEDNLGHTVIVPEIDIALLRSVKHAARVVWWLSIDFSPAFKRASRRLRQARLPMRQRVVDAARLVANPRLAVRYQLSLAMKVEHCVQSTYAWAWLYSRLGITASMLTDYTDSSAFSGVDVELPRLPLKVAFNPAKGGEYAEVLQRRRPDLVWAPIRNMTREEVVETLLTSAVYIDLGHHPGKDRMPREAALAGAVVIVARRGAGAYFLDTPINPRFKVQMSGTVSEVADRAEQVLGVVLSDLASARANQETYGAWIRTEQERFEREVRAFFVDGLRGSDAPGVDLSEVTTTRPSVH